MESEINHLSVKFTQIFIVPTMVSNDMKQTRAVPENVLVLPAGIKHSFLGKVKMVVRQFKTIYNDKNKKAMLKQDSRGKLLPKLYSYYFESRAMDVYENVKDKLNSFSFEQYNSVTIYSYWFYVTARVAVELKNNYFKVKKLYTFSRAHGYDINEHVNLLKFLPERMFLLDSLDNVFPVSQNSVDFLRKTYPIYKDKIEVRRLGSKKIDVKSQNDNKFLNIVSCSTVRKLKRLDLLIDSLTLLKERGISFKWTHIGEGPEFKYIEEMASKELETHQFHFTGHLKNSEVLEWYQSNSATVFVNTSSSEGVPVSIMEAMSMALPVIATDVGGTKEIVESNITGFLINGNCSKEDVADNLMKLLSMDEEEYKQMCKAAYLLWDKRCNGNKLYSEFANEISSINRK